MLGRTTRKTKKNYHHDSRCIHNCLPRVVFCSEYRYKLIRFPVKESLETPLIEAEKRYDFLVEQKVMSDHVHLLLINPKDSVLSIVAKTKGWTSFFHREEFSKTRSKFISSVGAVTLEAVKSCMEGQQL